MTSPVSFGDAYLMGKLALRLGRAFTKGRKSAPAEFREVENQLYSLSAALCALKDAHAKGSAAISIDASRLFTTSEPRQTGSEEPIGTMLRNCEETLKHLETTVKGYSSIAESRDSQKSRFKRWSRDLNTNWKKIAWTSEGGDLATLRSQLTVHTNGLNLILGVAINLQTSRAEDRMEQMESMLKDIHEWFITNLRDATSTRMQSAPDGNPNQSQSTLLRVFTFQLFAESGQGQDPKLICSRTSLHSRWAVQISEETSGPLFTCRCNDTCQVQDLQSHRARVAAYALSSQSLPVRLAGKERSWMLYKATDSISNRLVSLTLKNFSLRGMAEFEETFIHALADTRATAMLRRGQSTMLAYITPETQEERLLHLVGDLSGIQKSTSTVTFCKGQRSYTRISIEAIKLLHYRSFQETTSSSDPSSPAYSVCNSYPDSAEIVVFFDEQESRASGDVSRTSLQLKHNTQSKLDLNEPSVLLKSIQCIGLSADEPEDHANSLDVMFEFTTAEAAKRFHQRVEEMRMELFVMSLQYPRQDEKTLLKLQATRVESKDIEISDADITIVQNATTQRIRLIIVSRNSCSILSQELAQDFFSSLNSPADRPILDSRAFLVQMEDSCRREVYRYEHGFEHLSFSNAQTDRLFELGLATIAGSLPLQAIEMRQVDHNDQ